MALNLTGDDQAATDEAQDYTPEYSPDRIVEMVLVSVPFALDPNWSSSSLVQDFVTDVVQVSTAGLRQSRQALDQIRMNYAISAVEVTAAEERVKQLERAFAGLQYTLHLVTEAMETAEDRRQRLLAFIDVIKHLDSLDQAQVEVYWVLEQLEMLRDLPMEGETDAQRIPETPAG